ncbi:MAG: hypothetical protein BWK73_26835 [Thiothrix lacustris]|uniref:Uncharacterized protein n=1 Tax=Thiothrix lacustris TaxID=525917 RepID=A0A1Y1QKL4_9GAMM|nr:MAG: hypothetical protein BWK73_26835 [Thiothrix lacustris]
MNLEKLQDEYTIDLINYLRDGNPNEFIRKAVTHEITVRDIIRASAFDGAKTASRVEKDQDMTPQQKLLILADALNREECGIARNALVQRIKACKARLEKTHRLRCIHNAYRYESYYPLHQVVEQYDRRKHAPVQQHRIEGVPIDPCLPYHFDTIPNELREPYEITDWWGRAFVISHRHRLTGEALYSVRKLNGGAWDRSTFISTSSSLDFAVRVAIQNTQLMRNSA